MGETATFDETKAEAFAEQMMGCLTSGSLALLCSIGDQTGLFDTMAGLGWTTSPELATESDLDERYVREWLGGLVCGGVVDHDASNATYSLPAEHAAFLTSDAGPGNLARQLQFIPLLAGAEQEVIEVFRHGGGVPYSSYPRFHQVMADVSSAVHDAALVDGVLPMVDGLPARLGEGISVADVGCGRGRAVNLMARAFPASRFTGYDFSPEAIEAAKIEAKAWGLDNATFDVVDIAAWDEPEAFDFVTAFDAVHDQAHPARVLDNVYRALKPGGTLLMVDINSSSHLDENRDHPFGPFIYTVSVMHCMTVSLALDGDGLGAAWGRQKAVGMLDDAGFSHIEVHEIEHDPVNVYFIARK